MNRADVEMVNRSFSDLSDTLLKRRMLEQQMQESMAGRQQQNLDRLQRASTAQQELGLREKELGLREQANKDEAAWRGKSLDIQGKEADATQSYRDALLKHQQGQQAAQQLNNTFENYQRAVANGSMSPEAANLAAKALVRQVLEGPSVILRSTPFGAFVDNPDADIFSAPPERSASEPGPVAMIKAANELAAKADEMERKGAHPAAVKQLRDDAEALRAQVGPYERSWTDPNDPTATIKKRMSQTGYEASQKGPPSSPSAAKIRMERGPNGKMIAVDAETGKPLSVIPQKTK